jgi:hypothetical protein
MGFLLGIECDRLRGVSVPQIVNKVLWLCVGGSEREHGVNRAAGRTLRRDIVQADDTKVHVVTAFVRLREGGGEMGSCDSCYVLTYPDDRWAIKGRPSFAP